MGDIEFAKLWIQGQSETIAELRYQLRIANDSLKAKAEIIANLAARAAKAEYHLEIVDSIIAEIRKGDF
jgi:hypothetical protein